MPDPLLDPHFLRRLERLRIAARRAFPGTTRGERRSTRRGSSVEFADFRKYETGDDFRHVDWNIYARLERLILRQFVEEEDVRIDILIDQSASMRFGSPVTKFVCACRAAAALAFLGITSLDRVGVAAFDSLVRTKMRPMRGRGHLLSLLSFLASLTEARAERKAGDAAEDSDALTNLGNVMRSYQRSALKPGVLFVISDFLDPGDFRREMKLLAGRGFDLNLIQVLAPEEMTPEVGGDLLLIDSETGETREISGTERVSAIYRRVLQDFTGSLESFCRTNGIGYSLITADAAFEELLLKKLIESRMAE